MRGVGKGIGGGVSGGSEKRGLGLGCTFMRACSAAR